MHGSSRCVPGERDRRDGGVSGERPGKEVIMEDRPQASVLIADDHHIVLEGIRNALDSHPGFVVAGIASDGKSAVEQVRKLEPDILTLDVSMPGLNGVKVAERVKGESPGTRILVYSMNADPGHVRSLFRTGIAGYVLKEEPLGAFMDALETVRNGGTSYSRKIEEILRENILSLGLGDKKEARERQDDVARLSEREKEVFRLLADGVPIRDVADRLRMRPEIAETHTQNVFGKLGVRSVADLTKLAARKGLIEL
jgi:DNA-binding NarL/FixJ family response regulator